MNAVTVPDAPEWDASFDPSKAFDTQLAAYNAFVDGLIRAALVLHETVEVTYPDGWVERFTLDRAGETIVAPPELPAIP